jgi:hypothetical protein
VITIRNHRLTALLIAGAIIVPAAGAHAAYNPFAFDPFGDRDPFSCDAEVVGSDQADSLQGGTKPDEVRGTRGLGVLGLGGNDTLTAKSGVQFGDCMRGGAGDDRLVGGRGGEKMNGDDGNDHLDGGGARDVIEGGDGADVLIGGSGDDALFGEAGPDVVRGGTGNDWLAGGAERNTVDAGPGDDKVSSANGIAETVRCGTGKDEAWADKSDRLVGCERVHRIASLYPTVSPRSGGATSVFRASIRAPFTTESAAAAAGYLFDVAQHPDGKGCERMTLPPGQQADVGERVVVAIRSQRRGGFCRGLYRGTITFSSSDAPDNCQTLRAAGGGKLDECDFEMVLGRFSFRIR